MFSMVLVYTCSNIGSDRIFSMVLVNTSSIIENLQDLFPVTHERKCQQLLLSLLING